MPERPPRHPLVELTLARFREFVREPGAVFWVFGFPVLLAVALGVAFRSTPVQPIPVAIEATVPNAERIAAQLGEDGFRAEVLSPEAAEDALRKSEVDIVVGPARTGYTFRFDATRPESRPARVAVNDALQRRLGRDDVVPITDDTRRLPGARYIDFLIPGLIGLGLMGSGMWGVGYVVVLARTRKLLKRFAATPMRRSHYLLSFMLSRLLFLVVEVGALVLFGWLVFDVGVRGSPLALTVVVLVGSLSFTGLAMLVAARPQSVEAASGWMNAIMLPMWLLSGTFFAYERFPEVFHPAIRALPLTALNDALRLVMTDGLPLWSCWLELGVLTGWGVLSFVVALKVFRWQ